MGEYAVTEQMLQVCLGGGPGTGANSNTLSHHFVASYSPSHGNSLIGRLLASTGKGNLKMKRILRTCIRTTWLRTPTVTLGLALLLAAPLFAQQTNSPWENAVNVLETAFTSTIARGLSLVAIVVSGLTFAFGEGGSKRVLAGVLFGVGMAIAAVNFLAWLFPGS